MVSLTELTSLVGSTLKRRKHTCSLTMPTESLTADLLQFRRTFDRSGNVSSSNCGSRANVHLAGRPGGVLGAQLTVSGAPGGEVGPRCPGLALTAEPAAAASAAAVQRDALLAEVRPSLQAAGGQHLGLPARARAPRRARRRPARGGGGPASPRRGDFCRASPPPAPPRP